MKRQSSFAAAIFYYQHQKQGDTLNVDLQKPYLTYNEPQGKYPYSQSNPILLDFLISNCDLSSDGYKVALMIDGQNIQALTDYTPYYIYNLNRGKHKIRLELLDENDKIVPGFSNMIERDIEIDD